jgi:hypothetical protein
LYLVPFVVVLAVVEVLLFGSFVVSSAPVCCCCFLLLLLGPLLLLLSTRILFKDGVGGESDVGAGDGVVLVRNIGSAFVLESKYWGKK